MKNKLLEQAKHEYSPKQRSAALLIEAVFFLGVFPYGFIRLGATLDLWLQWPRVEVVPINPILGGLLIIAGWLCAIWSIYIQFTLGRGTPVPLMATQKLIVKPPYSYCRNPMALGAIMMYVGLAVVFGSIGALALVLLAAACLLVYIKRVEEVEMEMRFGQEYLVYKARTPFLLPRFRNEG
jgi:protein-S-isoprenylcysteine O-methyltransferase Ste14